MEEFLRQVADGDTIVWIITKDHIDSGDNVNRCNIPYLTYLDMENKLTEKFKIYDDDGELYYEGRSTNQSYENAFEPLDWAMANAGATEIQYYNKDTNKWETL